MFLWRDFRCLTLLLQIMHSLIIFASGKGSNAKAILEYFKNEGKVKLCLIVTNNPTAGVLELAKNENIPTLIIDKNALSEDGFIQKLKEHQPTLIILAGFLWKIPSNIITAFPRKIINIHPALLPKYGGKNMYGSKVHQAVLASGDKVSGITIHEVDEVYDNGNVLLQATCEVLPSDNENTLAYKIHKLEHYYYPRTIEFLLHNISGDHTI